MAQVSTIDAGADVAADVDVARHQHDAGRHVRTPAGDGAGHDAHAVEAGLQRHPVVVLEVAGRRLAHRQHLERQQDRPLGPLVDDDLVARRGRRTRPAPRRRRADRRPRRRACARPRRPGSARRGAPTARRWRRRSGCRSGCRRAVRHASDPIDTATRRHRPATLMVRRDRGCGRQANFAREQSTLTRSVVAAMSEDRRGILFGIAAYAIWGLFPLYWPLLEPAGSGEILAAPLPVEPGRGRAGAGGPAAVGVGAPDAGRPAAARAARAGRRAHRRQLGRLHLRRQLPPRRRDGARLLHQPADHRAARRRRAARAARRAPAGSPSGWRAARSRC